MTMVRWKPARWTPARMGRPRFLADVDDDAILMGVFGFGAGMVGGFKWIGKGMAQSLRVSPAAGSVIMGIAVAGLPILFGKEARTSQFALFAYGVSAGLISSAIIQFIFPKTSPAV